MITLEVIEDLLDGVYRLGLGVSRKRVLSRAGQLHVDELFDDYVPRDGATRTRELAYLGGRLADRAFQNLPPKFRKYAAAWTSIDVTEQERILHEMMRDLYPSRWWQDRGMTYPHRDEQQSFDEYGPFPNQTKSWRKGEYMPNCLGLALMLVGFARAAGAKHRVMTPIVSSWYSAMLLQRKQIAYNLKQLDTFPDEPYIRSLKRGLMQLDRQTLTTMNVAVDEAAHHALVIELADGSHRLVDPYMNIIDVALVEGEVKSIATLCRVDDARQQWVRFSHDSIARAVEQHRAGKRVRSRVGRVTEVVCRFVVPPRTKRDRHRFNKAILDAIMDYCAAYVTVTATQRPTVYEESHAEFSLAAYAVNHLAMVRGVQCAQIAIEAPFQHIIRDQLPSLCESLGSQTLPLMGMTEAEYLPELRQYLVKEEGVTHESEAAIP